MATSLIFTSAAEYLYSSLKEKMSAVDFIFLDKNKEGQRFFPDGETYARISPVTQLKNNRVVVLHSGSPKPNEGLVELELVLQILKDHQIKPEVFFTYFPYGRQDKIFEIGETNVAENLVRKLVNYYGVKKIYTIDAHFGKMPWTKEYPIENLSALPFLVKKNREDFGSEVLFMSPDKGGKRRTGVEGLEKTRINSFEVTLSSSAIPMEGKVIGVIDDMIETGGTLLRFCEFANNAEAKKVIALITHGVLDTGIKKAEKAFNKVYLANTINRKEANIDITDLIAAALNN